MTNSIFSDKVNIMFAQRLVANFKRDKRVKRQRVDLVAEQVKSLLATENQKLILMVRG